MKKILIIALAITCFSLGSIATAQAFIIEDEYLGPDFSAPNTSDNNESYTYENWDSYASNNIGKNNSSHNAFDLYGYTYSVESKTVTLDIYAKSSIGYFHPESGIKTYGIGDLFIATSYNSNFLDDTGFSGWNYVVHLESEDNTNSYTALYALENKSDHEDGTISTSTGTIHKGKYREPYAYFTPNKFNDDKTGGWNITNNDNPSQWDTLTITMDLKETGWDGTSNLLMQFTQVCGNDILRMEITGAPIPEPSTTLLFGVGLLGLAGFARRRNNN